MSLRELRSRINKDTKIQMSLEVEQWNVRSGTKKDKDLEKIHEKNHKQLEKARKTYKKRSGKDYMGFGR